MSIKIGSVVLENNIIVAPMAGVTNPDFRSMLLEFNPGLIYTEMVSDKAILYGNERTLEMCEIRENEHPIALQLFGSDEESMLYGAQYMDLKTTCDIIDINMGCPVTKVVKNGAGSAHMKDIDKAIKLVGKIVEAVNKPVTVKMRTGWDTHSINAPQLAIGLERVGVSALAVHGRTRSQMYSGSPNLDIIKEVKDAVSIPVIGNGDVKDVVSAKQMLEYTGCDGVMIGRATLTNPWVVQEVILGLKNDYAIVKTTIQDKFKWLDSYCLKTITRLGEEPAMKQLRSHALWLVTGMPHSTELKRLLARMKTYEEFDRIVKEYIKERVIL